MSHPLRTLLASLAGGIAVGGLSHLVLGEPVSLSFFGGLAGALAVSVSERWKAQRLDRWLRSGQEDGAPRDGGIWGELAYLAEKGMKLRVTAALRESHRLTEFLSAIDASPNGVLLLDADHQVTWCNRVAADHFGLDPQNDLRQRITNLVRAPAFVQHLQAAKPEGTVVFPAPGGRIRVAVTLRPYGEGQLLVLSQDITEQERTEAMRRDFVANVSHEIRTPLTVLAGFTETLGSVPLQGEELQRVLQLMGQQTDRMQALVTDLLTLSQLEGSPRPSADTPVPVAALAEQVLADARALSGGRHTIELSLAQADAVLLGARSELLSALGNLASNAVRYTPQGGRVDIRWRVTDDGRGVFEVQDSGPGISKEHWPRLTERFYRVDSGRSRESGGTGLGLAIVKHAIQRHGGELRIDSQLGRGSVFSLIMPARRVQRAPELAAA